MLHEIVVGENKEDGSDEKFEYSIEEDESELYESDDKDDEELFKEVQTDSVSWFLEWL